MAADLPRVPCAAPSDRGAPGLAGPLRRWLARVKYQQTNQTDTGLTYARTYIPGFAIVVAILLFPIGLLKSHPVARVKPATVPGGHTYAPGGLAPRGPAPDARSFIAV